MSNSPTSKQCFIISPIGEEGSDIRKRADQILKHVITPAAEACNLFVIRADKISEPGLITAQIIEHIINDDLVISDLTGQNPNVYYELALRHAVRKPYVQIVQKNETLPFDIAGLRTIPIDHTDLDSVAEARAEIVRQIKAVEDKQSDELYSPVTYAVDLQQLRKSQKPEDRSFGEMLSLATEIRSEVQALNARVQNLAPDDRLRQEKFEREISTYRKDIEVLSHRNRMLERRLYEREAYFETLTTRMHALGFEPEHFLGESISKDDTSINIQESVGINPEVLAAARRRLAKARASNEEKNN